MFIVSHPVEFLKFTKDTNSSQTKQFRYTITFKTTCFDCIESTSSLLENRSNVSTFIVHSGIPKAYNRWYSQYKSTCVRCLNIGVGLRQLALWVRIPPGAWMFVCCECCVLPGRGLCEELITRLEKSYRLWCLWRWDSVPKRRHIKFRRRGITQKKTYNIQNTAKVWNQ
jgi:hypothetical protein